MDKKELRRVCKDLGLTQERAARLLGVNDRTFRRYLYDGTPIPTPTQRLLMLLHERPELLPLVEREPMND